MRLVSIRKLVYAQPCHVGFNRKYKEQGKYWTQTLGAQNTNLLAGKQKYRGDSVHQYSLNIKTCYEMNMASDGQDRNDNMEDNPDACSLAVPFELCRNSAVVSLFI